MNRTKCFAEVVGFNDRWMLIFGIPLVSMLISLLLFNNLVYEAPAQFIALCFPFSLLYTTIYWCGLRLVYHRARLRWPTFAQIRQRMAVVFVAFLIIFWLTHELDKVILHLIPTIDRNHPNVVVLFISSLVMSALVITLYEALSFYLQLERAVTEKADLERRNVESQLEGLRNQVNPHFLFNSLNTLTYLIPEEPDRAVRFVQQLSKVYRYVLESRDAKLIPLENELDFLRSYIFLLRERFGQNLQVELADLNGLAHSGIVPLTLQILFENAIKHNVISTEKPLRIEVFAENGHLVVRNNLQRKNQVMDSTGVGLENIRTRYRLLADRDIEVIVSAQYFTVVLPELKLENLSVEYSAT
jgi:two-component system LytT family sensor kinase